MHSYLQHSENSSMHFHHGHKSGHSYCNRSSQNYSASADKNLLLEYGIADVDVNEDDNNIAADKFRQIAKSHATHAYPSYASILNYLCKSYKAVPSICLPSMDLYIAQGVFRI